MKIVQKVTVYNEYVGEETVGIAAMDSEHIQELIRRYDAAKLIAQVFPAPDIIEYREFAVDFFKAPNFYDLEFDDPELFATLDDGGYVLMDNLQEFGYIDNEEYARVEAVYMRIYTRSPNEIMWSGYVDGTNIEIELPGFYLDKLIQEVKAYEAKHSNQGSEPSV